MARTLALLLAYDGTGFVGWQRQAAGRSVQGVLEEALARIEGHPVSITGAGRTDAGVHALGQVASLTLDHPIPPADLRRALNAVLDPGVRVLNVEEKPESFHARYSARRKTYRYVMFQAAVVPPFLWRYGWGVPYRLDGDAMAVAAGALVGSHDFAAFQSAGSAVKTTVRTIERSEVRRRSVGEALGAVGEGASSLEGDILTFEIGGDGFLRHMVRAIVGSLVEVGAGRRDPEWFRQVLESRDRDQAGPTAPPEGLFLVRVDY